jgi:hypothetical protein
MEAIVFVCGLIAFGALAVRYGHDSREGLRSSEHQMALDGLTWNDPATDDRSGKLIMAPRARFPILTLIQQTLGLADGALTSASDAEAREARAQSVAKDCWSDRVWITGVVPSAAFRRLLEEVAPEVAAAPFETSEAPVDVEESAAADTGSVLSLDDAHPDVATSAPPRSPSRVPTPRPLSGAPVIAS